MYLQPVQDSFDDGLTSTTLEGYYRPQILPMEPATYPNVPPTNDPSFYSADVPISVNEPFFEKPQINDTTEDFQAPKPAPVPSVYLTGSVVDSKTGKPVPGVTMSFRLTGSQTDATEPEALDSSVYSFDATTEQIANYSAFFRAKGYIPHDIPLDILVDKTSITMTPDAGQFPAWIILAVIAAVLVYRKKTGKVGALGMSDVTMIAVILGGVLGFDLIKRVLTTLGIWDSRDTKDLDQEQIDPHSAWSPIFWKQKPSNIPWTYLVNQSQAEQFAATIYDAFGWFDDDEDQVKGVFRQLRTKANLSFIADVFQQKYNKDLLEFLRGGVWPKDRLSDADVNEINSYIKNLPNY